MNSKWISSVFLVAALSLFFADAQAQTKKKSVPTKKTSSKQSAKPKPESVQRASGSAAHGKSQLPRRQVHGRPAEGREGAGG